MKKFFSLIAAVLFAGSMMAQVTILPTDFTAVENSDYSTTVSGVTVAVTASTVTAEQMRIFKNQTITISAESNITSIEFTCTANGTAKYGPGCFVAAQDGYTFEEAGKKGTWTGSATSVTFTAATNQVRATQIVVTLEGGAPVVVDTYTVAGNDAAIFGEAWNPALAANDMTLAAGIYKWEKANLNLAAGSTIEFKVVKNHSWDIAYPAQNYVVNIAEAGEYTLTITFDPTTEAVAAEAVKKVIPQYEVAEAIAAGLAENDEILVRGVITKMEFKGKNFAKFGSVNIYVADATGAEGAFEFYNCYSLNADTFRTSDPAYDAESTAWAEFDEVADENGNAIHVGDTVIAFGKYKLYNETYELNTGCYLTEIKHPGDAPVEHTYTVAGDNVDLFGTAWTPGNEDNDMVLVEGLYTWEKTEQTLPAGNVAFKVCEDHAWTNCWPAQNYVLAIPEAGIYTITITFDPANDNAVNAVATKTGEAVVVPTVAMHGNFLGSWADTENFAIAQDNASASLTLTLAEGNYEFGMRIGGSGNWTANGAAFTRENNSAEVVAGQGNLTLAADVEGEYLFTWTFADNSLTITYPDAPVVVDTIKLDFNTENTTYAFVDNQYFSDYGSTDIYLSDINVNTSTNEFEGDGNYLVLDFYPENPNNVTGVYQAQDETLDLEYTYMLTINGTDTAVVEFADGTIQVEIGEVNKELGMAQLAVGGTLISTEGDIYAITALVIAYYDFLPEEGVEDVVIDPKAIKRIVNGQLIIEKNGVRYNANGQIVR